MRIPVALAFACLVATSSLYAQDKLPERIAALIERMADEDPQVRREARDALKKIGEPARDALVKAKGEHNDAEVRRSARIVVRAINEATAERLVAELGDKEKSKREAAVKALITRVDSADVEVKQTTLDAIEAAKKHADAAVRDGAAVVWTHAQIARIDEWIEKLGDDSFDTRQEASRVLIQIGRPAIKALEAASKDADLERQMRAKKALKAIKKDD